MRVDVAAVDRDDRRVVRGLRPSASVPAASSASRTRKSPSSEPARPAAAPPAAVVAGQRRRRACPPVSAHGRCAGRRGRRRRSRRPRRRSRWSARRARRTGSATRASAAACPRRRWPRSLLRRPWSSAPGRERPEQPRGVVAVEQVHQRVVGRVAGSPRRSSARRAADCDGEIGWPLSREALGSNAPRREEPEHGVAQAVVHRRVAPVAAQHSAAASSPSATARRRSPRSGWSSSRRCGTCSQYRRGRRRRPSRRGASPTGAVCRASAARCCSCR